MSTDKHEPVVVEPLTRRHLVDPARPPTSTAAADRRGHHHTASGRRNLSPIRAIRDTARLAALLRELPAIEQHCQARRTRGPDVDRARQRAEIYLTALWRDGRGYPAPVQIFLLAAALDLEDALGALDGPCPS